MRRRRTTAVLAYDEERIVSRMSVRVPVSKHPIDSVNLADPRLGLLEQVNELLARTGLERGRVDLVIEPGERNVGLTVNEYETLLMQNDLVDVLRNPLRFAKIKAHSILDDRSRFRQDVGYARPTCRVLNSLERRCASISRRSTAGGKVMSAARRPRLRREPPGDAEPDIGPRVYAAPTRARFSSRQTAVRRAPARQTVFSSPEKAGYVAVFPSVATGILRTLHDKRMGAVVHRQGAGGPAVCEHLTARSTWSRADRDPRPSLSARNERNRSPKLP